MALPRVSSAGLLDMRSSTTIRVGTCTYNLDDERSGVPASVARKLLHEQELAGKSLSEVDLPSPRTFISSRPLTPLPLSRARTPGAPPPPCPVLHPSRG